MKIIIYTVDCYKGRERLMPWRNILEVAKVMVDDSYDASILNACYDKKDVVDYVWNGPSGSSGKDCEKGVKVYSVQKEDDAIVKKCKELNPDVLFIPFTFRDGLKPAKWIAQISCKKIGYMAGGVYDLKSGLLLKKTGGLASAKPYLMEAVTPKCIFAHTLKKIGVSRVIGLTDVSTVAVKSGGFSNVTTIYPGKDPFDEIYADNSIIIKYGLDGKKWLLFSGAPAPTRGAEILLQALDQAKDYSIRLVMLMRTDIGSEYDQFDRCLKCMVHPERVQVIMEKVNREQLRAFFGSAWYALLPFIVIPSEVPLTYLELLACGTPVITFKNGGTTEYLKNGLLIADKSVSGLAKALDEAWNSLELRDERSENGLKIMAAHPTWEQVGREWIKLLK